MKLDVWPWPWWHKHKIRNNTKLCTDAHVPTLRYGQYLSHARVQPYHPGSGSYVQLFRPYWGSSTWHSHDNKMSGGTRIPFTAEASAKHSVYMEKTYTWATLGGQPFSYVSLKNWRTVYTRNKKLARLAGPAFLHTNILARQARSTRDYQIDNQGVRERCFPLLTGAEGSTFGDPLLSGSYKRVLFLTTHKIRPNIALLFYSNFLTSYYQLIDCFVCLSQAELIRRYDTTLKKPRGD